VEEVMVVPTGKGTIFCASITTKQKIENKIEINEMGIEKISRFPIL